MLIALPPTVFTFDKDKATLKKITALAAIDGEMRDAKWVKQAAGKKILLIARNNDGLLVYRQNE